MTRFLKKAFVLTLLFVMAAATLTLMASAAGKIDLTKPVSLTVHYVKSGTAVSGAEFDLYKVADTDAYGAMTLTKAFESYKSSITGLSKLGDLDQDGWTKLANTLKNYQSKLTATVSGKTDAKGNLTFSKDKNQKSLTPGLYLLIGKNTTIGKNTYSVSPLLVFLPGADKSKNDWDYTYEIELNLKSKVTPVDEPDTPNTPGTPTEKTVTRKVLKVWSDSSDKAKKRPAEITVTLNCNGKAYATVKLDAKNSWRYTWEKLPQYDKDGKVNEWTITEKEVSGYTVSIAQEGVTFTLTNTYTPPETPPETPPTPPENPPTKPETPENPKTPTTPTKPVTPVKPILPQTGQLWWPVPVLLCGGVLLIVFGTHAKKRYEEE